MNKREFNFRFLFAILCNNIGNTLFSFTLPLFLLDLTNSPIHLSIITMFNTLPYLIFSLPFGCLIDRFNKLRALLICDAISCTIYLVLSFFLFANISGSIVVIVYLVSFINGIVNVVRSICETSIIPELYTENKIAKANSFVFSTQYICATVLPILGGIMYAFLPLSIFCLINAFSFFVCLSIMYSLKHYHNPIEYNGEMEITNYSEFKRQLLEGIDIVVNKKTLLYPLLIAAITNLLTANFENNFLFLFKNIYDYSTSLIGVMQSVTAIGALLGSIVIAKIYKTEKFNIVFITNLFFIAISMIFLPLSSLMVIIICLILNAFSQSLLNILVITNRQTSTPKEYRARADGIYKMVLLGTNSIGALIGGLFTSYVGAGTAIIVSGLILMIIVILYSVVIRKNSVYY